jgi:hypothetical protein
MRSHGHATVWGTHVGVGCAGGSASWYQQLREWWAAHASARRQAQLAALHASWDAKREVPKSARAEAAAEMAAMHGALSTVTMLYGLSQ